MDEADADPAASGAGALPTGETICLAAKETLSAVELDRGDTLVFAPIDFDRQAYFNSLAAGDNNNRWRGNRLYFGSGPRLLSCAIDAGPAPEQAGDRADGPQAD